MMTNVVSAVPRPRGVLLPVTTPGELTGLLNRAAEGDQQAWNEIVDRFTNLLWSVGRAHRLDTATIGDVIQTTWLRLVENLGRIREPEGLAGWLVTTARRECLRVLTRAGREQLDWDEAAADELADTTTPPVDHSLLLGERDAALWQCFELLSARCQALLRVLMAVDAPSYAEVSAALDLPIGSIGPTRMRCLHHLRGHLAGADYAFDPVFDDLPGGTP